MNINFRLIASYLLSSVFLIFSLFSIFSFFTALPTSYRYQSSPMGILVASALISITLLLVSLAAGHLVARKIYTRNVPYIILLIMVYLIWYPFFLMGVSEYLNSHEPTIWFGLIIIFILFTLIIKKPKDKNIPLQVVNKQSKVLSLLKKILFIAVFLGVALILGYLYFFYFFVLPTLA